MLAATWQESEEDPNKNEVAKSNTDDLEYIHKPVEVAVFEVANQLDSDECYLELDEKD